MGFEQAWLSYERRETPPGWGEICGIAVPGDLGGRVIGEAVRELREAFRGILGQKLAIFEDPQEVACIQLQREDGLGTEGFHIFAREGGGAVIAALGERGFLYGAFELIRQLKLGTPLIGKESREGDAFSPARPGGPHAAFANKIPHAPLCMKKVPAMPLRMINHWDNLDGSIERGYAGESFFFENNEIIVNERTRTYARLMASVGINAAVINNVNVKDAATWLITDRYFAKLKELSGIFSDYGIKLFLCLNFAAPVELGQLDTADPLSDEVAHWWEERMRLVFGAVPNLGGFVVKADSEGRPGPFSYGRTHADGANMLARAAAPYGGLIIWRCFVYNCQQDWRDRKTDRARSGYDNFIGLDGEFLDNVILQIKNGPMDFQIREPVHPLFGGLKRTNQMLEVQLAQEYTGQQRHVCYLIPLFKEVLDFHTYATGNGASEAACAEAEESRAADGNPEAVADTVAAGADTVAACADTAAAGADTAEASADTAAASADIAAARAEGHGADTVADIVSGRTFGQQKCGMAAVANTGNDENWTGHDLAAANLYGFGRLAFEPSASAEELAREWISLTYGNDPEVVETLLFILMESRRAYEMYTAPLGIGWMVNPGHHYGPNVDGYEYDRWGTYHRADHLGIGVDRSHDGTGYAMLYNEPNASMYDDPESCPEELLLFFHHMPYTHRLKSGKTIIQHIYDAHFEGVELVDEMARRFEKLRDKLPEAAYRRIRERLLHQKEHSREWRDQINSYFYRKSGIPDELGEADLANRVIY